jgi:hypothetical protein
MARKRPWQAKAKKVKKKRSETDLTGSIPSVIAILELRCACLGARWGWREVWLLGRTKHTHRKMVKHCCLAWICLHAQEAREIPMGQEPTASSNAKSHRLLLQDVAPRELAPAPLAHPMESAWLFLKSRARAGGNKCQSGRERSNAVGGSVPRLAMSKRSCHPRTYLDITRVFLLLNAPAALPCELVEQ